MANEEGKTNRTVGALELAGNGYRVFPLNQEKTPLVEGGFYAATKDAAKIEAWWSQNPDALIAVPTGAVCDIVVLDVDNKNGKHGSQSLAGLEKQHSPLPVGPRGQTPSGGKHYYFRHPGRKIQNKVDLRPGIDIRGDGGYIIVPPSVINGIGPYIWETPLLGAVLPDLPSWLLSMLEGKSEKPSPSPAAPVTDGQVIPQGQRNSFLVKMAGSFRKYGVPEKQVLTWLWQTNVSRCQPPLSEKEVRDIAASAATWQSDPNTLILPATDSGNSEFFAVLNHDSLRYDHRQKRWLVFQEHWWQPDNIGQVIQRAKDAARERQRCAEMIEDVKVRKNQLKWAIKSENKDRIAACLEIAKTQPPLSSTGDDWDSDPFLLGVANGVVDLRTGDVRPSKPGDLITRHANTAFDVNATCPQMDNFLNAIMQGDSEMVSYLWRAIGYSLTGIASEQVFFLCHGTGSNGKSTLLDLLVELMGSYGYVAPFSTFDRKNNSSIPNDLAALDGLRLICASETQTSTVLNEARTKQFVHGGKVTARFLNKEFFTFTAIGKVWLAVNHRPDVKDDTEGFWRSVQMIPFNAYFPPEARDVHLLDKLRSELPGILARGVKGCLEWQSKGLMAPQAVIAATRDYRRDCDALADFLDAECIFDENYKEPFKALYARYMESNKAENLTESQILKKRTFGCLLTAKFKKHNTNKGVEYWGLKLK